MSQIKTFWWDERFAQSLLQYLSSGNPGTVEGVAAHLGIANVDALSMLMEMGNAGRVAEVTAAGETRNWVAAEAPLAGG